MCRLLLVALSCVTGCFATIGPTVAVRANSHFSLGFTTTAAAEYVGFDSGMSYEIGGSDEPRFFGFGRLGLPVHDDNGNSGYGLGAGAGEWLVAGVGGAQTGSPWSPGAITTAGEVYTSYMNSLSDFRCGGKQTTVVAIHLGIHALGHGKTEVFLSPQVGWSAGRLNGPDCSF